jgi:hypothetical protein
MTGTSHSEAFVDDATSVRLPHPPAALLLSFQPSRARTTQPRPCMFYFCPSPSRSPHTSSNPHLPRRPSRKGHERGRWRRHQHGCAGHHDRSYLPHCSVGVDGGQGGREGVVAMRIGMSESSQQPRFDVSTSKPVRCCRVWLLGGEDKSKERRLMTTRCQLLHRPR